MLYTAIDPYGVVLLSYSPGVTVGGYVAGAGLPTAGFTGLWRTPTETGMEWVACCRRGGSVIRPPQVRISCFSFFRIAIIKTNYTGLLWYEKRITSWMAPELCRKRKRLFLRHWVIKMSRFIFLVPGPVMSKNEVQTSILPLKGKRIFLRLYEKYGSNWKIPPFLFALTWSIWALPVKY